MIVVGQRAGWPGLSWVLLESHIPPLVLAVFSDTVAPQHWGSLGLAAVLAGAWVAVGCVLFRYPGRG